MITKDEFEAMDPSNKTPSTFYCTFKVHKPHEEGVAPPERPIISGSGSITENPSIFVEHFLKDIANKHPTYLQDTPDFLREIETINQGNKLPENAMLVTMDVTALFTNTSQEEGAKAAEEALTEEAHIKVTPQFIVRNLGLIQEYNIFEFDGQLWQQQVGSGMGQQHVPPYENIFMARRIDNKIEELARKYIENGINPLMFLKRFLDDLFLIFLGTPKKLHQFWQEENTIDPSIQFTMSHTKKRFWCG